MEKKKWYTQTWFLLLVAALVITPLINMSNNRGATPNSTSQYASGYDLDSTVVASSVNAGPTSILELVKAEPKVKDAFINDADVLYVGVLDDGTRRDGYAEYLCQLMKDNNSTVNRVKVVRFNSHTDPERDNAYGVLLGEAHCQ